MAIQLGKKSIPTQEVKKEAVKQEAPVEKESSVQYEEPPKTPLVEQAKQAEEPKGLMSALKRGKAAKEALANEEHKAEMQSKNANLRFWVKEGEEASITFVDGDLDSDGMLDIPFFYEHNIMMGGKYGNFFACTAEHEPCPICEGGNTASYVGILTIIDHRSYTSKKDNKTYKDQVRLFAAKRNTIKMLQKIAEKRGGLAGARFDVSRTGAQSPSVGSMFDFTEKLSAEQMSAKFGEKSHVLDYDTLIGEITLPADALRKMGFGSLKGPVGSEAGAGGDDDYEDKM